MNSQQNFDMQSDSQFQKNKVLLIIVGIAIVGVVLMGSCVGLVAFANAQKKAEEARIAKEKAEDEKREMQRIKVEAEKRAAEAEERERREIAAREEEKRIELAEKQRIEQENLEAEKQRQHEELNKPKIEVSKVQMRTNTEIVKGEFDFGIEVGGLVRNAAKQVADLEITAFLSCSGGEWVRKQHLIFTAGETKNLTYFFHEPNFGDNISNCQSRIMANPF